MTDPLIPDDLHRPFFASVETARPMFQLLPDAGDCPACNGGRTDHWFIEGAEWPEPATGEEL